MTNSWLFNLLDYESGKSHTKPVKVIEHYHKVAPESKKIFLTLGLVFSFQLTAMTYTISATRTLTAVSLPDGQLALLFAYTRA